MQIIKYKDKLNIEGTGKPVVEDPKKANIVRYAKNKLQSNPTILAKMAGKEGFHLSHLSLFELDSLKNLLNGQKVVKEIFSKNKNTSDLFIFLIENSLIDFSFHPFIK